MFLAPDDGHNAEGVAGQASARQQVIPVPDLPNLLTEPSDANFQKYAELARVSEWWLRYRVRKGKLCPCCLYGIPVEVKGRKWGVIVLDGKSPDPIPDEGQSSAAQRYKVYCELIPFFLDQMLRKV